MNPKIAKKWRVALRSGKYKQVTGQLEKDGGYCCLGVLCLLGEREGIKVKRDENGALSGGNMHEQKEIMKWAGFDATDGTLPETAKINFGDKPRNLITLNDDKKFSFKEIAEVIRVHADDIK